jgi:LacI family transcriptional regulator
MVDVMPRATIQDVAKAADLSVSSVNRALHQPRTVRAETLNIILNAAEAVGFYGIGSIRDSMQSTRPKVRLGILLLQRNRSFYKALGKAFEQAAKTVQDQEVLLQIDYLEELSPQNVSECLIRLAQKSDVIGVVAPEHPTISATIEKLAEQGKKFFGLISPLSARCGVGYVGLDGWKVGRTAGWAFHNMCKNKNAKIGILVGNHRFRCQEIFESGFRSYFREHANQFTLLEPQSTFENANIAREVTEDLISKHGDMAGLFVCGGGITGVIEALHDTGRDRDIFVVGFDNVGVTKAALLNGTLNFLFSHPIERQVQETIDAMIRATSFGADVPPQSISLPFEIFTPENL